MCPTGGTGHSLPRITAGTSSGTINTIQLMSNESPALPHVSQSHVSYSPGVRRVTSCHDPRARQLPPPPNPKPTVPTGTPGTATSAGSRVAVPAGRPYRSHLRGGGYREGAEPCWLATMAVEERPVEEKLR